MKDSSLKIEKESRSVNSIKFIKTPCIGIYDEPNIFDIIEQKAMSIAVIDRKIHITFQKDTDYDFSPNINEWVNFYRTNNKSLSYTNIMLTVGDKKYKILGVVPSYYHTYNSNSTLVLKYLSVFQER